MAGYRLRRRRTPISSRSGAIASDNPDAPDRVETAIYDACALLAKSPLSGQMRKEFTSRPVRFWTVQRFPSYLIVYRPDARPLEIIRILHGMRDVRRILHQP
jgi:plasmid stabilization system protein ParE